MTPDRVEFVIGANRFKQPIRLVRERGSDGKPHWTIYRDEADQRDDRVFIGGLDAEHFRKMAEAVAATP